MSVRLFRFLSFVAVLSACAHAPALKPAKEDLTGVVLPLIGGPTLRWVVSGEVNARTAEIDLEVAAPLTLVTTGCFATPAETTRTVRVTRISGEVDALPEVTLPPTFIGGRALLPRPAGLVPGADCKVVLGSDVLGAYALRFSPETWNVQILPSLPATEEGSTTLALSRDPLTDRLLLPAKVVPAVGHALLGAFILSTASARTLLSEVQAASARIETDRQLANRLNLPKSVLGPVHQISTFSLNAVELTPGLRVAPVTADAAAKWFQPSAVGVLALDVWGRFEATLDLPAQRLTLRRPAVAGDGWRRTCGPEEEATQEGCFSLHSTRTEAGGGGVRATLAIWRDLPEGGRLYLDPVAADGTSVRAPCRIAFNLPAGDRGVSISQVFPWPELQKAFPACADALTQAHGAKLLLFEDEPQEQCAGRCAMAIHPRNRAMVCSCASSPGNGPPSGTERSLELFRRLRDTALRLQAPPRVEEEPEPED